VRGDRRLFRDVSFALPPGTLLQLSGANGSGKTSLLRILCGLLSPASGEIRWRGAKIQSLAEEFSRDVTYIGHRHGVKEELSALENLRISSALAGFNVSREKARAALERFGLLSRENLAARFLSEGQRRRSTLARLLTCQTTLWLLDEVLASLDRAAGSLVESLISEHLDKGGIAIVATHQELHISANSFQRLELESSVSSAAAPRGQTL
jgi:heme exporter protein A